MDIKFNSTLPKNEGELKIPLVLHNSFKYASLDYAYKHTTDEIRHLIDNITLKCNRKNVLIDIKFHSLDEGEYPAIPGWHIDCTNNPLHDSRADIHHIWVHGSCLTEFLKDSIILDVDGVTDFNSKIPPNTDIFSIKPQTVYTYGRFHIHRAAKSTINQDRLLVRITETDIIRPINKVYNTYKQR